MKGYFSQYHPFTHIVYFSAVLSVGMIYMDPVILLISFICVCFDIVFLSGARELRRIMLLALPAALLAVLINPVVSHRGITVLAYLPDGNPLTRESICFGIAAAVFMLSSVGWFYLINRIFTADRIICLLGRISPGLALMVSMTIGFVGKFRRRFQLVRSASAPASATSGLGPIKKLKISLKILSAVTGWSLENAADTADTMNSLGYGLRKRSFYTRFRILPGDMIMIIFLLVSSCIIILSYSSELVSYGYYPVFITPSLSREALSVYLLYAAVCLVPLFVSVRGELKWKYIQYGI